MYLPDVCSYAVHVVVPRLQERQKITDDFGRMRLGIRIVRSFQSELLYQGHVKGKNYVLFPHSGVLS